MTRHRLVNKKHVPIETQILKRCKVRGDFIGLQDKARSQHEDDVEGPTAQECRGIDGGGAGD